MQETLTFPTVASPHHRFTFSQSYYTDYSEGCSPVSTPFVSAPSSPGRHRDGGFYFSAPTSPHWTDAFAAANDGTLREYPPSIPLHWDEKPGTPRRKSSSKDEANSFITASDFEFSARFVELNNPSMSPTPMSSANELFCNGQIKPLRIPVTRPEHPLSSTSHVTMLGHKTNRINVNEHPSGIASTTKHAVGYLPSTLELSGSSYEASSSSISAPHSPQFSSMLARNAAPRNANSELNRGKSASSLSAPQSPRTPLNRMKGALCGVSPSKIDRAFDASIHLSVRASPHNTQVSSKVEKGLGTSMQMPAECSIHTSQVPKQASECFRRSGRSVFSLALRSHGTHRRTRSFSPLRIFQWSDQPPSQRASSSVEIVEQEDTHTKSQDLFADEKRDEDSSYHEKAPNKRWTLKDLLHRKSGGENRSNSSRTSSRRSAASADSVSSVEKAGGKSLGTGRSSSESSHSSTLVHECTRDAIPSMSASSSKGKTTTTKGMDRPAYLDSSRKGLRNIMYDARTQNLSRSTHNNDDDDDDGDDDDGGKAKSSTQKAVKAHVQKGSKGSSISTSGSSEAQCSMHNVQPERAPVCEVSNSNISNSGKAKITSQRGAKHKSNKECASPHEMHYMMHKAQTEELRKKTFLPYKQGLLGCLGFTSRSYRTVSTISKTLQSVSG